MPIGNINENTIEEIYNSEEMLELKNIHKKGNTSKIKIVNSVLKVLVNNLI